MFLLSKKKPVPKNLKIILTLCLQLILGTSLVNAQVQNGVYISDIDNIRHELKINDDYMVYSAYQQLPPKFIRTLGGFLNVDYKAGKRLTVSLEFDSDYQKDSLTTLNIPLELDGKNLILDWNSKMTFIPLPTLQPKQALQGKWLFATRGPDEGQERRSEESPRKTLKILQDNRFQWIAYNTDSFKFSGTGGGSFTSQNGKYIENIEYFSKDDSRVGATLEFNYEIKNDDWHHTGTNSKGEPLYEIWSRRK